MRAQVAAVYLFVLLHFVAAGVIPNNGSILKNSRLVNTRKYNRNNNGITMFEGRSQANAPPVEYLKTPNFDVMLLSEEKSDPMWKKYSELFQPKDLRNAQQIEVNYGSHTAKFADGFQSPFIRLDRSEVESVLASLGDKKHIIVLHPRNCKPHSTIIGVKQSSLDEFENEFLPKLLQQLHKRSTDQCIGSDMVDPVVDRILMMLDNDEQKMIDDLRKTFEVNDLQCTDENPMYSSGYTTARRFQGRTTKKAEANPQINNNLFFKDPCNEGYVFLVQNQKNAMDPNRMNDLLLRVLKVVEQFSR